MAATRNKASKKKRQRLARAGDPLALRRGASSSLAVAPPGLNRPNPTGRRLSPAEVSDYLTGLLKELTDDYEMSVADVADVLDVTPKTLSRNKRKEGGFSYQQTDRLRVLDSILTLGRRVLGSEEEVKGWLRKSVFSLEGQKPIDLIKTESGRRRVEGVLHQIEHGIF